MYITVKVGRFTLQQEKIVGGGESQELQDFEISLKRGQAPVRQQRGLRYCRRWVVVQAWGILDLPHSRDLTGNSIYGAKHNPTPHGLLSPAWGYGLSNGRQEFPVPFRLQFLLYYRIRRKSLFDDPSDHTIQYGLWPGQFSGLFVQLCSQCNFRKKVTIILKY